MSARGPITCEVGAGAKGPLVFNVLHFDNTRRAAGAAAAWPSPARPVQTLQGAVKWFEPRKGYGFISPDGGGKDVFVHINRCAAAA